LPTLSEAATLAKKYDVPGVPSGGGFWTDDWWFATSGRAAVVWDDAPYYWGYDVVSATWSTVCVTDPSA
jgi:hypothetical protein